MRHLLVFNYDVHLVLDDQDVFQLHNVDSNQMLFGLWLGKGLVSRDQQQSCVHDCSTSKHGGHEGVVTGAVDKGDVSRED